jgi:hypothetical protein
VLLRQWAGLREGWGSTSGEWWCSMLIRSQLHLQSQSNPGLEPCRLANICTSAADPRGANDPETTEAILGGWSSNGKYLLVDSWNEVRASRVSTTTKRLQLGVQQPMNCTL